MVILQSHGFLYVHGRDRMFRPCVVLNSNTFERVRTTKPEICNMEIAITATVFVLEYVRSNMFLPGQVENWVGVNDLGGLSVNQLPKKELQGLFQVFVNNYKGRMGQAWAFNCTSMQLICWRVLSIFIPDHVKATISFNKEYTRDDLLRNFHPSQLEKRFGGEAETPSQYWPPIMPPGPTMTSETQLLTEEEYHQVLK